MFPRGEFFAGAGASEETVVVPQFVECGEVVFHPMFLAPVGVEVLGRSGSVCDRDAQVPDDAEDVFEVFFPEAGTVEVINAQPDAAGFARQFCVEEEVGGVAPVEVAGGGGREPYGF